MYIFIKKNIYTLLILIFEISYVSAQERKSVMQVADEYYTYGEYKQAAELYEKVVNADKAKTSLLSKVGNSYRLVNDYNNSFKWYSLVINRPDATREDSLAYGDLLMNFGYYKKVKEFFAKSTQDNTSPAHKMIARADSALNLNLIKSKYKVSNFTQINTPSSEWGMVEDNKKNLVFTSNHPSVLNNDAKSNVKSNTSNSDQKYYKIYQYTGPNNEWRKESSEFSNVFNVFDYHVGSITFSADKNTAYFTVTNNRPIDKKKNKLIVRKLEIFISKYENGVWGNPIPFKYNNEEYSVGHPAFSSDGNRLYFVSDNPIGFGKTDIWYCELKDGNWSEPKNCGPTINTSEEEEFPYVNTDGVLHFSSKGHYGLGGFDIFYAKGAKNEWEAPINLKAPINSSRDDFYLVMEDEDSGYLSSNREGGVGSDDIYKVSLAANEGSLASKSNGGQGTSVKNNSQSGLKNNSTQKSGVESYVVGGSSGSAVRQVVVQSNSNNNLYAKEGDASGRSLIGNLFIVYSDLDEFYIRPDAYKSLDSVKNILLMYPDLKIKLNAYTDARGSFEYNMALSERRAKVCKDFLVGHGIAPNRIIARGYGSTNLVVECPTITRCTEDDHQKNRRTEILIL